MRIRIDAKADYCWKIIDAAFGTLSAAANFKDIMWLAIDAAVNAVLSDLLIAGCQAALGFVNAIPKVLSMFTGHLCLPIPKLHLPHFGIPAFGSGACNGATLGSVLTLNANQPANKNKIHWKLWNHQVQQ